MFAIAYLSLTCVYMLHALIVHIYYMLDIYLCLIDILAWFFYYLALLLLLILSIVSIVHSLHA